MSRRLLIALLCLPLLGLLLLWSLAGMSPRQLPEALDLATGLGAKLACSGRYLSGFDDARNREDLASYSALTRLVSISYQPPDSVYASMLGSTSLARFRPGLGCTLEYAAKGPLDRVQPPILALPGSEPWPRGSGPGTNDAALTGLLQEILRADNARGLDTRALLVAQGGQLLAEAYGPGINAQTPLLGWSMGKSVIAILQGRLEAEGRMAATEQHLFPQWEGDGRAALTVQNLLQMSSGLDFAEDYIPGSDSTRMLFMAPSASAVAMASALAYAPGEHFAYSSGTTNLLARLVYERSGGSAQAQLDFFARSLGAPLGLEATTMEADASGVFVGSSFVYASGRDWARLGQLMVNGGEINGHRVLDPGWVKRATAPNGSRNETRYGYQFWLNGEDGNKRWPSLPDSAYAMQGNRAQVVMLLPSHAAVVVRLGWTAGEYPVDANIARILAVLESAGPG